MRPGPLTRRAPKRVRLLGEAVRGADPAAEKQARRNAETVAELCDAYWADAEAGRLMTRRRTPKKASTLVSDKGRMEKHIKPLLGRMKVAAVTREDVEAVHARRCRGQDGGAHTDRQEAWPVQRPGRHGHGKPHGGAAGRDVLLCRQAPDAGGQPGAWRHAAGRRASASGDCPMLNMQRWARHCGGPTAQDVWPAAVAVAWFLALTGWRSGEALALRWAEVDLPRRTARLPDTKTGASMRPLSHAACDVLRDLPRMGDLVFPPTRGGGTHGRASASFGTGSPS